MISLPETTFTERLIQENGVDLARWAFVPGMMFGATGKWWGDRGQRPQPHEGMDLCLYQDRRGNVHRLLEQTRFPALYGGTVVQLCDDFLGRSVMIEHDVQDKAKLYVMYGHTVPRPDLEIGQIVHQGEVIAYLASLPPHKTSILPHLHVSLGWAPSAVPSEQLDWAKIPDVLVLLDPVQVLGQPARMLKADHWTEFIQYIE